MQNFHQVCGGPLITKEYNHKGPNLKHKAFQSNKINTQNGISALISDCSDVPEYFSASYCDSVQKQLQTVTRKPIFARQWSDSNENIGKQR